MTEYEDVVRKVQPESLYTLIEQMHETLSESDIKKIQVPLAITDVTADDIEMVDKYNTYLGDGKYTDAIEYRNSHPEIEKYIFDAAKINALMAYVASMYLYAKNAKQQVTISETAPKDPALDEIWFKQVKDSDDNVIGIVPYAWNGSEWVVLNIVGCAVDGAYELSADGWSASAPYKQTISVSNVTEADAPIISVYHDDSDTPDSVKEYNKNFALIDRVVSSDGALTFWCYNKKPTISFKVKVKGV